MKYMSIPESTLSQWSHHLSAKASKQAHVSVRDSLAAYEGVSEFKSEVFLQGSYKDGTNLPRDSDVDVVVRLPYQLKPGLVALSGERLQGDVDRMLWGTNRPESLGPRTHPEAAPRQSGQGREQLHLLLRRPAGRQPGGEG